MEATSSEDTLEATDIDSSTDESVQTQEVSEETATEEEAFNADLSDVPEAYRKYVEENVSKIEKDFKGSFTRKTQELAEQRRTLESEREVMQRQLQEQQQKYEQLAADIRDAFQDPTKLDAYKSMYGAKTEVPPEINTVDDLLKYQEQKFAAEKEQLQKSLMDNMRQELLKTQREARWDSAMTSMRQDPKFAKWENQILQVARDKYSQSYRDGMEKDILEKAYGDFKVLLREEMEAAKAETINSMKQKKSASTAAPKKTITTESSGGLTPEEIIERVKARLGE